VTALAAIDLVIRKTSQVNSIKAELAAAKFDDKLIRRAIPPSVLWLLALGSFGAADLAILAIVSIPRGISPRYPMGNESFFAFFVVFLASVIGMILAIAILFVVHFGLQRLGQERIRKASAKELDTGQDSRASPPPP
jgi:hypothetical protein